MHGRAYGSSQVRPRGAELGLQPLRTHGLHAPTFAQGPRSGSIGPAIPWPEPLDPSAVQDVRAPYLPDRFGSSRSDTIRTVTASTAMNRFA